MRRGPATAAALLAGALPSAACAPADPRAPAAAPPGFVRVPAGRFVMGAAALYPEEGPPEAAFVSAFDLKAHEVSNAEFAAFIVATSYVTEAEQRGGSARFVPTPTTDPPTSPWRLQPGASWRAPEGPGSDLRGREDHPVVHVTRGDARAYAAWARARLPQEVEWEYAATRGLGSPTPAEAGAFDAQGGHRANIWTGPFPVHDTGEDGFAGTSPVGSFPADRTGAHDLIGNVWEWTDTPFLGDPARATIKGGSYLCAPDHCRRYRPAARQAMEPDFSGDHIGFRIVKEVDDSPPFAEER